MKSVTELSLQELWRRVPDPDTVEHVLALPTFAFSGSTLDVDGLLYGPAIEEVIHLLRGGWYRWVPRPFAEKTEAYRQIIPYIAVMEARTMKLLVTHRTKAQTEARLHDKYSLGVGGHVTPEDGGGSKLQQPRGDALTLIAGGLERELREELHVNQRPETTFELIGILNDTSMPVSRCHLGLAYVMTVPDREDVGIRETENMHAEWLTPAEIYTNDRVVGSLEGWARMIYLHFYDVQIASTGAGDQIIWHGGPGGCGKPIGACSCDQRKDDNALPIARADELRQDDTTAAMAGLAIRAAAAERERDAERHRKQELGTALVEARRALQSVQRAAQLRPHDAELIATTAAKGLEASKCS